jgi:hypothetical protein
MDMPSSPDGGFWRLGVEVALASGAALLAGYVRAKTEPKPLTLASFVARAGEAFVCGFIAVGLSSWMQWGDPRTTVGLAAGLGLMGTSFISDLIVRLAQRHAPPKG